MARNGECLGHPAGECDAIGQTVYCDGSCRRHDAYKRGQYDASRDRAPLFRNVRGELVPSVDDPMADEWSQYDRAEYMRGYDDAQV